MTAPLGPERFGQHRQHEGPDHRPVDEPTEGPARGRGRLGTPGFAARTRDFVAAGVLEPVDLHVVDCAARLAGVADLDVLLALALAVRAPRHGHVCAEMRDSTRTVALEPDDADEGGRVAALAWPPDNAAWLRAVAACAPLVRAAGDDRRATPFVLDGTRLYLDRWFRAQGRLVAALRARAALSADIADPALLASGLAALFDPPAAGEVAPARDRQRLASAVAVLRRLTVITGGPGTGKTTTVRKILALLYAQWAAAGEAECPTGRAAHPLRIALAAPTGKAAARMKEAIRLDLDAVLPRLAAALGPRAGAGELRRFLEELEASTLHRLLGYRPRDSRDGDRPGPFRHHRDNPLPFEVVIVDEASMIDFSLMAHLVDAVPDAARLVLVGDHHQLASVEAGTVLRDICGPPAAAGTAGLAQTPASPPSAAATGAPRLSRSFAASLRRVAGLDPDASGGAVLVERPGLQDCIVQLDRNWRFRDDSGISRFAAACVRDPFDAAEALAILSDPPRFADLTILGPADGGLLPEAARRQIVDSYRTHFELLARGPAPGENEQTFHLAVLDAFARFRVLCAHRRGRAGVGRLNEAIAQWLVEAAVPGARTGGAAFHPGRPILVLQNDYDSGLFNGDIGLVVARLDGQGTPQVAFRAAGGEVKYVSPSRLPEHETVYAMTIHKAQGSEFARAMVVLPERPSPILTRELVYTAVTRAREQLTLVANPGLLGEALGRTVQRASGMADELWAPPAGSRAG